MSAESVRREAGWVGVFGFSVINIAVELHFVWRRARELHKHGHRLTRRNPGNPAAENGSRRLSPLETPSLPRAAGPPECRISLRFPPNNIA
jgi:hypothetical protein